MVILVAVDGSEGSRVALDMAATLAEGVRAQVVVLSISQIIQLDTFAMLSSLELKEPASVEEPSAKGRRAILEEAEALLRSKGLTPTLAEATGDPASQILVAAERHRADLIVIGPHGQGGLTRFLLGSVSEKVARHAPCSVLIARKAAYPAGS